MTDSAHVQARQTNMAILVCLWACSILCLVGLMLFGGEKWALSDGLPQFIISVVIAAALLGLLLSYAAKVNEEIDKEEG